MPSCRVLCFDLDDTLWPCRPTILAAEAGLYDWLRRTAPRLTARWDIEGLREHRRAVAREMPAIAHDLTLLRRRSLEQLLEKFGYDPGLSGEGMALFRRLRNRVEPYPEVARVLRALRGRHLLIALTNGNVEMQHTPLAGCFDLSLTAADVGEAKPHPALFEAALAWAGATPAQAVHLGDDPQTDVMAARAAGLQAVWMNRAGRRWPGPDAGPVEVADLGAFRAWLRRRR